MTVVERAEVVVVVAVVGHLEAVAAACGCLVTAERDGRSCGLVPWVLASRGRKSCWSPETPAVFGPASSAGSQLAALGFNLQRLVNRTAPQSRLSPERRKNIRMR